MADNHSKEVRSYNMSRIQSANTKPEELVRKYLFAKGMRFRKNDKRYPGRPDIVLPKYKTIIFVNGCFWHMHDSCSKFVMPKSNADYWTPKLMRNKKRDQDNINKLEKMGWNVIVIWECELSKELLNSKMEQVISQIQDNGIK
ncbi:MAG: DNA mismatch endonuclease Vsr [Oscillospiraceae bacterium]|nr:DNA mismatch endonuclease Vsr [Oscillospiraceae bacterium]